MTGISTVLPQTDTDAQETKEWLDALAAVVEHEGPERAHYLIETLIANVTGTLGQSTASRPATPMPAPAPGVTK